MRNHLVRRVLSAALLSLAPLAIAQEFPTTPQPETMQQAIQYQKKKDAADALQARKEAGEVGRDTRVTRTRTAKVKSARKAGQADRSRTQ